MEDLIVGDIVRHKASDQKMVIAAPKGENFIKCRYLNDVTGKYEVEEFRIEELLLDKGEYKGTMFPVPPRPRMPEPQEPIKY